MASHLWEVSLALVVLVFLVAYQEDPAEDLVEVPVASSVAAAYPAAVRGRSAVQGMGLLAELDTAAGCRLNAELEFVLLAALKLADDEPIVGTP